MAGKGQKDRDEKLKERLQAALAKEKDFSGYDINVRVVQDRITLQGIVDTLADKNHARRVAAAVEGAGEIENRLTVSTDGAVDDRHVYMEVRQELAGDPRLEDAFFNVRVKKGVLTLGGRVESAAVKQAALEAAAKAMGVTEIRDELKVVRGEDIDDADIVNEVRRAFAAREIGGDRVEVDCRRGVVSLQGSMGIEERNRLIEVVAAVPGVKKVKAHLVDTARGSTKEAARAGAEISRSFAGDPDLGKLPLSIYEEEGRLILEGLVADTDQKRRVDRKLHSLLEEYGRDLTAVENKIRLPD
jgi:hyperosmotically inducible periplasmic protein